MLVCHNTGVPVLSVLEQRGRGSRVFASLLSPMFIHESEELKLKH